jgi:hypothetical protein
MTRGLGRIPAIRSAVPRARNRPGSGISAGPDTHAAGRAGYPAERDRGPDTMTGPAPGRRNPGLAPGALGWPWHPRRLATARHRGHRVE